MSANHVCHHDYGSGSTLVQSLIRQGCRIERSEGMLYLVDAFWTARQRQAHSLHEISYRGCFKPQLPAFFIERLTTIGDRVFDPFMGRGTTPLQAALMQRHAAGSDQNRLCVMLSRPRLCPPTDAAVRKRLAQIDLAAAVGAEETEGDLQVFYHPETLRQLRALRNYLLQKDSCGALDAIDAWIRMVALNRLSGHSSGFFSVRTMPPNQAVSVASQKKMNARAKVEPVAKDVRAIILNKTRSLLRSGIPPAFAQFADCRQLHCAPADKLLFLAAASVDLVVTSPPFLNVIDYRKDNWLRCWFAGIDSAALSLSVYAASARWQAFVRSVFQELGRIMRPGGHVVFEVGEVHKGTVLLERLVAAAVVDLPFYTHAVLIHDQRFTKTSNCWGITNNRVGTNTQRMLIMQRT